MTKTLRPALPAIALIAALVALGAAPLPAASPSAVAVVTDLSGKVESVAGGRAPRAAAILDELAVGTRLTLAKGSRVVVLWLDSGVEYEVEGPAKGEIQATEIRTESGAPAKKRPVFTAAGKDDLRIRPQGAVQASVLMRAEETEVKLLSPVGTKILDPRPTFEWKPLPDIQGSRIRITDDSLKTVVEAATTGSSFRLPEEIRLKAGTAYSWEIEARNGGGRRVSGWAEFSVATDDERSRVERVRPKGEARFGERVAFALLLDSLELFGESKPIWQALAAERPGDPVLAKRIAGGK